MSPLQSLNSAATGISIDVPNLRNVRDVGIALQALSESADYTQNEADQAVSRKNNFPSGKVYRGIDLSKLDQSGEQWMRDTGITTVIDLRTKKEIAEDYMGGADKIPEGVHYYHLPIDAMLEEKAQRDLVLIRDEDSMPDIYGDHDLDLKQKFEWEEQTIDVSEFLYYSYKSMRELYAGFAQVEAMRTTFGQCLDVILSTLEKNDGAVYIHCRSGKDRTGWLVMLLQAILRIDPNLTMQEYLLSSGQAEVGAKLLARRFGMDNPQIFIPFCTVYPQYLREGVSEMLKMAGMHGKTTQEDYFSAIDNYLNLCGFDEQERVRLRSALTIDEGDLK
jgi:protein-tyrosine phosphatase